MAIVKVEFGGTWKNLRTQGDIPGVLESQSWPKFGTLTLLAACPCRSRLALGEVPIVSTFFYCIFFLTSLYLIANVPPTFWLGYYIVIRSRKTAINQWFYFCLDISLFGKFICSVCLLMGVGRREPFAVCGDCCHVFIDGKVLVCIVVGRGWQWGGEGGRVPYSTLKYYSKTYWQLNLAMFVGLGETLLETTRQGTLYVRILNLAGLYLLGRRLRGGLMQRDSYGHPGLPRPSCMASGNLPSLSGPPVLHLKSIS